MKEFTDVQALEAHYKISERQLKALLRAQASLRAVAEETMIETRAQLERVAESLCPEVVNQMRLTDPDGLEVVETKALTELIVRDVGRRLAQGEATTVAEQSAGDELAQLREKNAELQGENERLKAELSQAREEVQSTSTQASVLQQNLESAQRRLREAGEGFVQPPLITDETHTLLVTPDNLPEWIQKWQGEETYEKDTTLLSILASKGLPRRTEVQAAFAEEIGQEPRSGTSRRTFGRLAKKGLIELIQVRGETVGRNTPLVRLTDTGRDACRLLLGIQPVESQTTRLLKRHRNPEHAMLNLQTGDVLRACDYEVDLFPDRIELEGGRIFEPDLVATRPGQTCYVEVERLTYKDDADRHRKWDTYYAASGGEFFIAVADRKALDGIKGEVMHWAGQRKLVLWMCNISQYIKKPAQGAWAFKRGEPRSSLGRGY